MNYRAAASELASLLQRIIEKRAHFAGKVAHAQIFRLGFSDDVFLSNRLVELYSRCGSSTYAVRVFDTMQQKNVFSWNALISCHCKAGDLDYARQLLMDMPERNVVSWNTVISALSQTTEEDLALDLYCMMRKEGFSPTHFTLASVLSACGNLVTLQQGCGCHGLAVKLGLDSNSFVANALIGMYMKCGSMTEAIGMFDAISEPNEVAFTALISGLIQGNSACEALGLFVKLHQAGINIDDTAVSTILGACSKIAEDELCTYDERQEVFMFAQAIHGLIVTLGFDSYFNAGNCLIDMYAKFQCMDTAEVLFLTLPKVNVVSWNILIRGFSQVGDSEKAMVLLERMQHLRHEPDDVTYSILLSAFIQSRCLETAIQFFGKISNPGVSVWNTILSAYADGQNHDMTIHLFKKMQFLDVHPDRTTIAIMLSSCSDMGNLYFGRQIHAASTRLSYHTNIFVTSGLVDMYSKCGNIEAARHVFARMPERDVVSWNSMISGLALHSLSKDAFDVFKQMKAIGMSPTQYSYASIVSSCARLSSLMQGRELHALTEKDGFSVNVFVGSSIIDMYAKCGRIEDARLFFDQMPIRNVVSWNEMIHGYAQNGLGESAVALYANMLKSEEKPDSITFIAALTACSHSGLVDEALKIFYSMETEHAVKPLTIHYTCMIDTLGRAGCFDEVKVLIDRMPCKDDPIVWEVLLSACRVHSNDSIGKLAAEQLFRLDPQNSSPYVLLANIYAELGRWGDVSIVRKLMNDRSVIKDRAYSWIHQKDGVQSFMVDEYKGNKDSSEISKSPPEWHSDYLIQQSIKVGQNSHQLVYDPAADLQEICYTE